MNPNLTEISKPTQWKPGQSGNLSGRPVGTRRAFSAGFLRDLAEVWSEEGRETMIKTARDNPSVFFAICARLIGPEVKLTIEQSLPGNLSARDWAIMREIVDAVKTAVPDATNRRAGEVLEYVRSRLIDSAENALAERGCLGAIRHPPSRSFTHGSNALAAPLRHARQRPRWHFSTRISKCARCGYPRFLENAASWEI
jgi:hypothetical protein